MHFNLFIEWQNIYQRLKFQDFELRKVLKLINRYFQPNNDFSLHKISDVHKIRLK